MDNKQLVEIEALSFDKEIYDLDGLVRLVDSEEGAFIFTFEEEDEAKHYMNRYDLLECNTSIDRIIKRIHHYLESDSTHGLFISFAVVYKGQLRYFNGRGYQNQEIDMGDLELGDNMIYGMLIKQDEAQYLFDEVLYFDGGNTQHSWAEKVLDGGELTFLLKAFIEEFSE